MQPLASVAVTVRDDGRNTCGDTTSQRGRAWWDRRRYSTSTDLTLQVPRDVSVVGYDDSPLIAFTDPPLTTVRQGVQAMAEAAVRALLEEIGGEPAPRAEYVFRPELVVRSSTGACPTR